MSPEVFLTPGTDNHSAPSPRPPQPPASSMDSNEAQRTARTAPEWLDDIEGEQALAWASELNEETLAALECPRFRDLESRILEVLQAPDRIPGVTIRGGWAYNFWTDATNPRGLWRRQKLEDYLANRPDWETLLDIDALAHTEGKSLVFHGAQVLRPDYTRALIDISEGGSDADETREFDLETKEFLPASEQPFTRGTDKGSLAWVSRDVVWARSDMGPGSLSASGYPLQARLWARGSDPASAPIVIEGKPTDLGVFASHDHTPGFSRSIVRVAHDFLTSTTYLVSGDLSGNPNAQPLIQQIKTPPTAHTVVWREWLLVVPREDWETGDATYPGGALIAFALEDFLAGQRGGVVLFAPDEHSTLETLSATRHHLLLMVMTDVVTHIEVLTPPGNIDEGGAASQDPTPNRQPWRRSALDLSAIDGLGALNFCSVHARGVDPENDDHLWLTISGYLTPTTLVYADLDPTTGSLLTAQIARRTPARFAAEGLEVSQHFATSADGTRVPYFQVGRPGGNQAAPTVLYGYGGFEVSLTPGYTPSVGRALLEHGGTYVVANIRGGGEYGPHWHEAARGPTLRERAYEDFAAVARDLVARGVTTPSRLGIQGGSNGGLLTGVMYTRFPELFGAVVIQAPLLDMRRYHTLLAGSSWVSEYGDPDDPAQWEHIRTFSPFHLYDPRLAHPPVLVTTSTKDDRVHPAHARTFAWLLRENLADVLYWENIEGGHSGAADAIQRARMSAVVWEFLWRTLT